MSVDSPAIRVDTLHWYLESIRELPLLSADEQRALAIDCRAGSEAARLMERLPGSSPLAAELNARVQRGREARAQLIQSNLRLVVSVAKRYRDFGVPLLDLIQAGNVGLLRAADKYNPDHDCRFSTYAYLWIRQTIRRTISCEEMVVHLPESARQMLIEARRQQETEESTAAVGPRRQDAEARKLAEVARFPLSLDVAIDDDERNEKLGDRIHDADAPDLADLAHNEVARLWIEDALQTLPLRARWVVILRFGFDGEPRSLNEVGALLGVSRQRVAQIEQESLRALTQVSAVQRLSSGS